MSRFIVELPDTMPEALGMDAAQASSEVILAAAMKLYEMGRLSAGAAATFAGLGILEFQDRMPEFGVNAFRQGPSDIEDELSNARNC